MTPSARRAVWLEKLTSTSPKRKTSIGVSAGALLRRRTAFTRAASSSALKGLPT